MTPAIVNRVQLQSIIVQLNNGKVKYMYPIQ